MRDLKVDQWMNIEGLNLPIEVFECLASNGLRDIVAAFIINIKRATDLSYFPQWMIRAGKRAERAEVLAQMEVTGKPFPDISTPEKVQSYLDTRNAVWELAKANMVIGEKMPAQMDIWFQLGEAYRITDDLAKPTYEIMMESELILLWGAFEVLATDLWVTALNIRPRTLGYKALLASRGETEEALEKDDKRGQNQQSRKKPAVEIDELRKYGFDLGNRLGEYLKDGETWKFNAWTGIQKAYQAAFGKANVGVFDPGYSHGSRPMRACEAFRHILVHNAGVVDQKFRDRVDGDEDMARFALGTRAELDGEFVTKVRQGVIVFSSDLIRFVDAWLKNHPDNS